MKKLFKVSMLAAALFFGTSAANAQGNGGSDEVLMHKAIGAAAECLQDYRSPLYEITANVEVIGICFVEGFIRRVTIYAGPNCNGDGPCPAFPTRAVATVDYLCGSIGGIVNCLE